MSTMRALLGLLLGLGFLVAKTQAQPGHQFNVDFSKGVRAFHGEVVTARKDLVEIILNEDGKKLSFQVNEDSKFEEVDAREEDGRATVRTKVIQATDLHGAQPISVMFFADGKQLILLRAIASGPKLSGLEIAKDVEKLGGKLRRIEWVKDRVALAVDLSGTQTSDDDLALLRPGKSIESLDLSFTRITNQGIGEIAGFNRLGILKLTGTRVTDAAIDSLRLLPALQTLDICQTQVTDEGVFRLVRGTRTLSLGRVGLGEKAHFRVHQEYSGGKLVYNYLMIGDTYFGRYYVGSTPQPPDTTPIDRRREATTYYHRDGPIGQVMNQLEWFKPAGLLDYPSDARMPASLIGMLPPTTVVPINALVGLWSEPALAVFRLNVGTHAAYGRPFQQIHFYNGSPETKAFCLPPAGQPVYFGFISDALQRGCQIKVIDGPERAMLAKKAPKRFYQAMFVEITRNDLRDINTDLMTKEALAEMMDSLTETGVLCFHTSHRYYKFALPISDAAKSLELCCKVVNDFAGKTANGNATWSHFGSEWAVIARQEKYLRHLTDARRNGMQLEWSAVESTGKYLWRDGQPHDLKPLAR